MTTRPDSDGSPEKYCPKCQDWWPADTEFFHRNPSTGDGLAYYCKACQNEARARTHQKRKELKICQTLNG